MGKRAGQWVSQSFSTQSSTNKQIDAQGCPIRIHEILPRQVAPTSTCRRFQLREALSVKRPRQLCRLCKSCGSTASMWSIPYTWLIDLGCLSVRFVHDVDFTSVVGFVYCGGSSAACHGEGISTSGPAVLTPKKTRLRHCCARFPAQKVRTTTI